MIKVNEYARRMGLFDMHIELLRQSLKHFSNDKKAMQAFVDKQERECSKRVDIVLAIDQDRPRDELDDIVVKAEADRLRREIQHHVEFADNKINQMEIILRCAYFEAEMKDIHRHCLCAKPALLRGDKEIALGRLVADGEDKVLEEEIEAEVERIDRQSAKEKAKYFKDKLGLKWGDPKLFQQFYHLKSSEVHNDLVLRIERYSTLRNEIVHEHTDHVVQPDELKGAHTYFTFVPSFCCFQAVKLYPTHFAEE